MIDMPRKTPSESKWDLLFENNSTEWISFRPELGLTVYPCYACRHMFSCRRSFQDHINRRAMILVYKCSDCCNTVHTFYNRCSFLLHSRKHYSEQAGQINLSDLNIHTLPIGLAGFLPHPNIALLYDDVEEFIDNNTFISTQFYTPRSHERGKSVIKLKPDDLIFLYKANDSNVCISLALRQICSNTPRCEFITVEQNRQLKNQCSMAERQTENITESREEVQIKEEPTFTMPIISKIESLNERNFPSLPHCPECNRAQKVPMTEHFLGDNIPFDESLKCVICKFIASTPCSLKAHIRIHDKLAPFVCPDCGKDFTNFHTLKNHMEDVCFHVAKHVRYRCPGKKCGKLFAVQSTYATHFEVHMQRLAQCTECNTVLFEESQFEDHVKLHEGTCELRKIYNCTVCKDFYAPFGQDSYKHHINWHIGDRNRCMYIYICKNCRSYFRSTTTYAMHSLRCSKAGNNNVPEKKTTESVIRYFAENCLMCGNKIVYREDKPVQFCIKCSKLLAQIDSADPSKENTHSSNAFIKKYYCMLCNKELLFREKGIHLRKCKYRNPVVIINNQKYSHSFKRPENLDDTENSEDDSLARSDETTEVSPKKKRKRTKSKKLLSNSEAQLDLQADNPMLFDGTYYCKICKHSETLRSQFHAHIVSHRDVSTAYQCMECGECFVVKPSFIKHLVHYHNVDDIDSYLSENNCYDKDALKKLEDVMKLIPGESKEPVGENQCKICLEQFSDSVTLRKHFRIHGMAFLLTNSK